MALRCASSSGAARGPAWGALEPALAGAIEREAAARGGLSAELPGLVYERARASDRAERRAAAIYYTPPHLVDFTVEKALAPLVRGRSLDRLLELRVVDPACGGGAFLLAALRRLEQAAPVRARGPRWRLALLRRCLLGIDLDPQAAAVSRLALSIAVPEASAEDLKRAVLVADALDPASAPAGAFDAVVTNPPWGGKGYRLDPEDRRRLRALYASARGAIDPFALFVERAHALLRPGGRWGMVLPEVILLKNHEPLRRLILRGSALDWIAEAGRAFPGVNMDAVVMVGRRVRQPPGADHEVAIARDVPESWRARPPEVRRQRQAVFARLPGARFNLHLGERDLALLDRLAALPRLGDRFEVHEGVHSGNARARLFLPARPPGRSEEEVARLVVGRGEIARYRLRWAGAWLDLSPRALDRAAGHYANLGRPEWHRREKVVVRRTGDHLVAAHDPDGLYVSNNMFVVLPRDPGAAGELRALVAILNSALLTWCFRAQVPRVGRLFAELKIQHLSALPLPPPEAWTADAVAALDRLARRRARCDPEGRSAARLDATIDDAVFSLYRLTPAERRLVAADLRGRESSRKMAARIV